MNIILRRNPTRALTLFSPSYRPTSILDEIDELARDIWTAWRPLVSATSLVPHTEMYEEKDQLVMKTELPGIKAEDLDITLDGDMLRIKAEKKREEAAEDATYHLHERYYGQYYRSISLPFHVDGDKISAAFDNGVLEIRLPKAEQAKAKQIEVKAQISQGERKKRQRKPKKTES